MKNKKKKVTLEDLSKQIESVSSNLSNQITDQIGGVRSDIENLAGMTKREFDIVHGEIDELRSDHKEHGKRLANLELDHEEIKGKLDQAAYKFEVKELEARVERLEKRTGLASA